MIVKNFECYDNKFIDIIIDELIKNNINYVLIKDERFTEIHFDNYIYRFFSLKYEEKDDKKLSFIDSMRNSLKPYKKEKKVQPGYKKYNKAMIKKDNFRNKTRRG